jgi:hypothetical protein
MGHRRSEIVRPKFSDLPEDFDFFFSNDFIEKMIEKKNLILNMFEKEEQKLLLGMEL